MNYPIVKSWFCEELIHDFNTIDQLNYSSDSEISDALQEIHFEVYNDILKIINEI